MKKLLSIFLLLTLSFAFSACGDSDDEPEKFVWGGDWNNPSDPNYKAEYNGKYNPIQGLWRSNKKSESGIYFSQDFKWYPVRFASNTQYAIDGTGQNYQINDKAFSYGPVNIWLYKVVAEGKSLMLYSYTDSEINGSYYTKIEER